MLSSPSMKLITPFVLRSFSSRSWRHRCLPSRDEQVLLGCVSYDPSVQTIWEKMRSYMNSAGCNMDFVLYTNYEQQVAALVNGRIDIAWNGPVAHIMSQQHAGAGGLVSLGMRDCDRDFVSLCVARRDAAVQSVSDVAGKLVVTGASDSPQGHVVPLYWLSSQGIRPKSIEACDIDLGKHGDTALGEIAAMEMLLAGKAQVGLLSSMMWNRGLQGQLPSIDAKALSKLVGEVPGERPPLFDHCQFDALASNPEWKRDSFKKAIFEMDIKNAEHTEVMKLEGISKSWMPTREEGYEVLRKALAASPVPSGTTGKAAGSATSARAFGTFAGARRFASSASQPWSTQRRSFSATGGTSRPTVGVIGGGIAGLQTIRAMRAKGFEVKAFEKASTVGGVWRAGYMGFGVQVPKQLFEFPDFPFKVPWGEFPTGEETQKYIEDYVDHFNLGEHMQMSTAVQSVVPSGKGWNFTVCKEGGQPVEEHFDYCVVSTGMYSVDKAFLPDVPGKKDFTGEVIHSTDFRKPAQAEGKNVVVVGGCKSAMDCAVEASNLGAKVTLVSRSPHWTTPRKIAWLIPFQYVFLSRFGQALVTGHRGALPGAPAHMSLWHKVSWPVMAAAFTVVEALFSFQFGNMTGKTSPLFKKDIVEDFYGYASVLEYDFRDKVKKADIDWQMGSIDTFESKSVQVNGEKVAADTVIFATGYKKDYSVFSEETLRKLNVEDDGLYLWRHTVPANVPNLAFVGSELACISNISSYGLQAAWLSHLWSGKFEQPSVEGMEKEIDEMKTWKRKWMPKTSFRASLVLLHQTHYHDILLKDMAMPHMRKMPNPLAELLMPYECSDYDGIVEAGRSEAGKPNTPALQPQAT